MLPCILSVPMETSPVPLMGTKSLLSPAPPFPTQRCPPGWNGMQGFPAPWGWLTATPPCPAPQHYRKDKGAICTKLVRPKRKQGTKSAQEELAKGRSLRPFPPTVAQPGEAPPCGLGTRPFAMCRRAQHCGQKAWAALGLGRRCPQAPGSPVLSISAASLLSPPSTCHLSQTPGPEPPSHLHPLRARS